MFVNKNKRVNISHRIAELRRKIRNKEPNVKPVNKTNSSNSNHKPLINILTRTSDRPNGFKINLDSIHNQTYFNIRHLVSVDNDETEKYVKVLQKQYNFEYFRVDEKSLLEKPDIPDPKTGKRFIWNKYFNILLDKVTEGYIMYLDDDDRLANKNVLQTIVNRLDEDTITYWQMKFQNGWIVPPNNLIGKKPEYCRIGSPCFMYHSKYKHVRWDGWKCGDYRLVSQLDELIPKRNHIESVLVLLGNNGGQGDKIDIELKKNDKHYTFVVTGWNCDKYVDGCLNSLIKQSGSHNYTIEIVNDASTDSTHKKIQKWKQRYLHKINYSVNKKNMGAAYSRWKILQKLVDKKTICVLVDLDDKITLNTLNILDEVYTDENIKMTFGKVITDKGNKYKMDLYSKNVIDNNLFHKIKEFKVPHLRTFRSYLLKGFNNNNFKIEEKWVKYCTDVILLIPMLKKINYSNIKYLNHYLYIYTESPKSTLNRFGKDKKNMLYKKILNKIKNI